MAINDGDILSALQNIQQDTSKISQSISTMSEKDLHQIQQDLSTLVRISQGTSRTADNDRFRRERDERTRDREYGKRYSQGTSRSSFSRYGSSRGRVSSSKSSYDGIIDEFLDNFGKSIEEELAKSVKNSPLSKQLRGYIKKFADDLGIEVSQIPSALGKDLGKYVINNTQFGQKISSTLQGLTDKILGNIMGSAKRTASDYARSKGTTFQDMYSDFVENFRRRTETGQYRQPAADSSQTASSSSASSKAKKASSVASDVVSTAAGTALGNATNKIIPNVANKALPMLASGMSKALPSMAKGLSRVSPALASGLSRFLPALAGGASKALPAIAGGGGALATTGGGMLTTAGGGAAFAGMSIPQVAIIALAAYVAIKKFTQAIGPAVEGIKKFTESAKKVQHRYFESQKEMIKTEQERIKADVKTMAETPFKIMTDAAQKWYDAWDSNLKTIGQTQGYTKADVQTLFDSYATRLRAEGLGSVVSAADISSNLGKVLESGLSGKLAEEFAYQAALLGSAVPSQDFFGYAATYAEIAGNAMAKGMNLDNAIAEANKQLQQYVSNLLYAGRDISNGIATALKDGSTFFADSAKIAYTAHVGDLSQISAVLTSAAAQVSAIAPDLASDLISNIVQAAVGGNNSDLVALRSMAGIGASNTAFIQALATNPQQVFAAMFSNLATLQNLDKNNYMEVAESLSQTFGISASAFARIDFTALAQAISSMEVNTSALSDNIKLLKSGETTPTAESMRMQQVNQTILDEGLAYVLDSEAGRAIQQHMWDQELANEIMEREYSVDFAGSAKEMIQGIFETIHNILNFLNPFSWIGGLANLVATGMEYDAQKQDLRNILEASKVGSGNVTAFRNLTNYNGSSLNTVPSLLNMLGLSSNYDAVHAGLNIFNNLTDLSGYGITQLGTQTLGALGAGLQTALTSRATSASSKYSWGFVGKSLAKAISSSPMAANTSAADIVLTSNDAVRKKEASNVQKLLDSMDIALKKLEDSKSLGEGDIPRYEEWRASAMQEYKITDFSAALEQVGLTEAEVKGQFEAKEAQAASAYSYQRDRTEDNFWEQAVTYYTETFPNFAEIQLERMQTQIDLQTEIRDELQAFYTSWSVDWLQDAWKVRWLDAAWKSDWIETTWKGQWVQGEWQTTWLSSKWDMWKKSWDAWFPTIRDTYNNVITTAEDSMDLSTFLNKWTERFVTYKVYSEETNKAYEAIKTIQKNEDKRESGDAVLALAKALTASNDDMVDSLVDPQVQTNALLSQILIVLEAIMQAENTSGGASLATSLSALGLGLTTS